MDNIISQILIGESNKICLSKKNSNIYLWWENSDKWFCNIKSSKKEEPTWVIKTDLEDYLDFYYLQKNYKLKSV